MKLEKDGRVLNIDNENHIAAFLSSGWELKKSEEVAAEVTAVASETETEVKPTTKRKKAK